MSDVINLKNTVSGKFQALIEALSELGPVVNNMESQFGTLGMVSKIEEYLQTLISKKLGWNIKIHSEIKNDRYVTKILASTIIPTIFLSRKFTLDIIKAAKKGDVSSVVKKLKKELFSIVHSVRDEGVDPFEENYNPYSYIIVEGSTVGTCFHAAVPVDSISLVDTDSADKAYIAQELKNKKNHFILRPTTEQVRSCLVNFCKRNNLKEYLKILKSGNIRIIKEHIQEDVNKSYKILGNNIILSNIRYK